MDPKESNHIIRNEYNATVVLKGSVGSQIISRLISLGILDSEYFDKTVVSN
jgi:hypothetical protein